MSCYTSFFYYSQKVEFRTGFYDHELVRLIGIVPELDSMVKELSNIGFRYCGDTNSDSKAYTDVSKKIICIGRQTSSHEACLSMAYEMTNAKNAGKLQEVHKQYLSDQEPCTERAYAYAEEILLIEAEAVFFRSATAIRLGQETFVKNQRYIEITRESNGDLSIAISEIFLEMRKNGMVHNGKKRAVDHYAAQYFEYTATSSPSGNS